MTRKAAGALFLLLFFVTLRFDLVKWRASESETRPNPGRGEVTDAGSPNAKPARSAANSGKIIPPAYLEDPLKFLSTAPPESLALLPGIGPVLAERLVSTRSGKRLFTRWEELLAVKGIGPKTVGRLKAITEEQN